MTWFKVDDAFPTHRKVLAIPRGQRRLAAVGAWTLLGAWCAANGTEGAVGEHVIAEFGIPAKAVADLLDVVLLERVDGGYAVHDYLDYNPTAEQVEADRAAARERQRRARERARESRTNGHGVTNGVTNDDVTAGVTVPPSRPDPISTEDADASSSAVSQPGEPKRMDVERLCSALADLMVSNGCPRPKITDKWRDAARLLIDRDNRPLDEALAVLDWCQVDEFWRANIHSLPTFRARYDQLRLAMTRGIPRQRVPNVNQWTEEDYRAGF